MKLHSLADYCRSLPHVIEDVKWGNDLCFSITEGRMFCVFSIENEKLLRVSFKVEQHRFLELTDQPQFIPAPYMARAQWVSIVDDKGLDLKTLKAMVKKSYDLYFAKLSKKKQRELAAAE